MLDSRFGAPICRGDATDMTYVPSNSFDIVFTSEFSFQMHLIYIYMCVCVFNKFGIFFLYTISGYIGPIQDPLSLKKK